MLKSVSSITNALGALNYKGTWDANANSPLLTSSVGTKGDYYVVGTAGSTSLNGVSNWGVGDWVVFNGSAWQRVEGGADLNGVNLTVTGNSDLGNVRVASNTISSTNTNGNIAITPNGTGEVDITKVDIDGGAIDGTTIGAASRAAGSFSSVTSTGKVVIDNAGSVAGTTDISLGALSGGAWLNTPAATTGYLAVAGNGVLAFSAAQVNTVTGSAANPGLSTLADTNTGIWYPAADTIEIVTGGVGRARYKSDGFEYNPKKQFLSFNPWPGNTTTAPNFAYLVLSNTLLPNGQEYLAVFSSMRARTAGLNATLCTGMTITIGYCNDSVSDGSYTDQTVDPTGFTALQTFTTGWETVDPGDGFTPYNTSGGFGWIYPKCMSFPMPFTFNVASKKLVLKFKLWGTGGSILMNESSGLIRVYQITASSA
jgi:hypothetical protein